MINAEMLPTGGTQLLEELQQVPRRDRKLPAALLLVPGGSYPVDDFCRTVQKPTALHWMFTSGMLNHLIYDHSAYADGGHSVIRAGRPDRHQRIFF